MDKNKKEKIHYVTTSNNVSVPLKKKGAESVGASLLREVMYKELNMAIMKRELSDVSNLLGVIGNVISSSEDYISIPNFHLEKMIISTIGLVYNSKEMESLRIMLSSSRLKGKVEVPSLSNSVEQDNVALTNMLVSVSDKKYDMEHLSITIQEKLATNHLQWLSEMEGFDDVMKRRGQQLFESVVYSEIIRFHHGQQSFDERMELVIPFMRELQKHVGRDVLEHVNMRLTDNKDNGFIKEHWSDSSEMFLRVLIKDGVLDTTSDKFFALLDNKNRHRKVSEDERAKTDKLLIEMKLEGLGGAKRSPNQMKI